VREPGHFHAADVAVFYWTFTSDGLGRILYHEVVDRDGDVYPSFPAATDRRSWRIP